ncbi:MAG: hypothetical protein ACI8TP_003355 [Acidimicrobiales bacterium]|jgi:hypothetical protein
MNRFSRYLRSRGHERGAAIVETALITPLLLLLSLGGAEVGFRIRDHQTVTNASRAAARVISSSGDSRLADYDALSTLQAALGSFDTADVVRIIVFKPEPDGSLPVLCEASAVADLCTQYDGSDLSVLPGTFVGTTSCTAGSPDENWCPLDRERSAAIGPDWIGVRVEVQHESFAPYLADRLVVAQTVMRLEPRFQP